MFFKTHSKPSYFLIVEQICGVSGEVSKEEGELKGNSPATWIFEVWCNGGTSFVLEYDTPENAEREQNALISTLGRIGREQREKMYQNYAQRENLKGNNKYDDEPVDVSAYSDRQPLDNGVRKLYFRSV